MKAFKILFHVGFLKLSKYIEASFVNIISSVIFIIVQYYVWQSIMKNTQGMGYSFYQMFSYVVYSQVITYFYPGTLAGQLGNMIKTGDISLALMKPVSVIRQLIYENMGTSFFRFLFISLPVLIIGMVISGFHLCVENIVYFLLTTILSYAIFIEIDLMFGMMQFYTISSWGINSLKYALITLLSGRILPLSIYPKWSREILKCLPFQYFYDIPLEIVIGQLNTGFLSIICLEFLWVVVLWLLFYVMYQTAIKRVVVLGG